ncbi:MAG: hypothetical protein EOO20_03260 [Chryseobacterium sp.]|nr:MAG: hypothetical protein EOO20_03260 [Chryseobacterium sp.]
MNISLVDIGGESAEPVAGFATDVLICPIVDLTTIIDPPAFDAAGDPDTKANIIGPHIAAATKGFTKIITVVETNTIKTTFIGGTGGQLFQNEAQITIAGSNAAILGFLRMVKNMTFIALLEEFGSGNLRQMGSKRMPARFTGLDAAIEAASEGRNNVVLTITDKQKWPAPIYTGDVPMKPEA